MTDEEGKKERPSRYRGLKPWKAGAPSPNSGGRPRQLCETVEKLRENADEIATEILTLALKKGKRTVSDKIHAQILFDTWDRMFGCPAQAVLVEGSFTGDGSGMTALLAAARLANDERVDQKIAARKAATTPEASDSSPIIDVTAEAPAPAPAPASTWQEKPLSADPEPAPHPTPEPAKEAKQPRKPSGFPGFDDFSAKRKEAARAKMVEEARAKGQHQIAAKAWFRPTPQPEPEVVQLGRVPGGIRRVNRAKDIPMQTTPAKELYALARDRNAPDRERVAA